MEPSNIEQAVSRFKRCSDGRGVGKEIAAGSATSREAQTHSPDPRLRQLMRGAGLVECATREGILRSIFPRGALNPTTCMNLFSHGGSGCHSLRAGDHPQIG